MNCWDRFGPHQVSFVSQAQIDSAKREVVKAVRYADIDNLPSILALEFACKALTDLENDRWRNINREPFSFLPGGEVKNDLLAMIGLKVAQEVVVRR